MTVETALKPIHAMKSHPSRLPFLAGSDRVFRHLISLLVGRRHSNELLH
jgi:hypothetical protein